VVEIIRNRMDMEVKQERDYIRQMKTSGYRSYHMIIFYEVDTLEGPRRLQMEVQIRTMAMNFWATVEHSLQYKYKRNIPEHIKERLLNAADAIIVLDNEMSNVRSEIMDAQISFQIQANIVADILNNIQNLYNVANKREIVKIQDEFYRIYAMNDIEKLERFDKQLDMIAEGYRAQALPDTTKIT
jgi:putative GTP pyrophosphokinase